MIEVRFKTWQCRVSPAPFIGDPTNSIDRANDNDKELIMVDPDTSTTYVFELHPSDIEFIVDQLSKTNEQQREELVGLQNGSTPSTEE